MGAETSSCDSSTIMNLSARELFEKIRSCYGSIPDNEKSKSSGKLVKFVYESLKHVPSIEREIGLIISGNGMGPQFLQYFAFKISFPETLTKVSLRKSFLKKDDAKNVARFLISMPSLKQFDASENEFGDEAVYIIREATGHRNLVSLQLENCHLTNSISGDIVNLIKYSRSLETLRLSPLKANAELIASIKSATQENRNLTNLDFCNDLESSSAMVSDRNSFIYEFVDTISRSPFQRQFRTKIDAFKSVKGREMLMGRAKQKEKARGTDLFTRMDEVDERARVTETQETVETVDKFRSGHAEMIGRRPKMEDVSIIIPQKPTKNSSLFGLFDGHGGREAAEFASQHLPELLEEQIKDKGDSLEECYVNAFKKLQFDMRPWCVYVGCTACLAVIEGTTLTVANIGDTRCILCRDGKAMRLSVDHKPDLPEETAYIQSKGGFVRDERVGGMLAVSRAFGDGFLGESVNPTPHFVQETLSAKDQFIILACDGVWDVISDQQACDIVQTEIDPLIAAKKLRDSAYEAGSTDNISVIIISLSNLAIDPMN